MTGGVWHSCTGLRQQLHWLISSKRLRPMLEHLQKLWQHWTQEFHCPRSRYVGIEWSLFYKFIWPSPLFCRQLFFGPFGSLRGFGATWWLQGCRAMNWAHAGTNMAWTFKRVCNHFTVTTPTDLRGGSTVTLVWGSSSTGWSAASACARCWSTFRNFGSIGPKNSIAPGQGMLG